MKDKKTKELLEAGIKELQFEKLCAEDLKVIIEEIDSITDDPLIKAIIKNGLERYNIDRLIHTRIIFKR